MTSTKAWDRPLVRARAEIYLPEGTEPTEFSFLFVRQESEGQVFCLLETTDFLPDLDITVRWVGAGEQKTRQFPIYLRAR